MARGERSKKPFNKMSKRTVRPRWAVANRYMGAGLGFACPLRVGDATSKKRA